MLGAMMSGFEITSMILISCQTHSVQLCSTTTFSMLFALLLCSAEPVVLGGGLHFPYQMWW